MAPRSSRWSPSRRELTQLALVAPWLAGPVLAAPQQRCVQKTADGEPQFVEPPGEPSVEQGRRIAELGAALAAGRTTTDEILADAAANELRPYPAFRETIAEHAPTGRAVLTPRAEPGVPLLATVRVIDRDGRPYAGVRVYAYQTSALGWYAAEAPHVSGNSGDFRFARLFTHVVTDGEGRAQLTTVHPAGYPRSDLPSHIHLLLAGRGGDERVTEIRFEDCPRMTPAARAESLRAGFEVVPVETVADGSLRCAAEFRLLAS